MALLEKVGSLKNALSLTREHSSQTPKGPYKHAKVPITIVWDNLTVVANGKGGTKTLLDGVSGFVEPNQMLAIMGPSGCGKTTLLNTLAGRSAASLSSSGTILLNGHKSTLAFGKSAYVTQELVLIGTMTVRETLLYAAMMRLPADMTLEQKATRVDEVIGELGLEVCAHTKIGNWYIKGISGGQKRRVAIGLELVTHPTLLFLDEPTSGLDAASAYHVMKMINTLAVHSRTILAVIHQPSSEVFDLFDQLCLLSEGKQVYFGDAHRALDMFEAAGLKCPKLRSATDHFLHVINKEFEVEEDGSTHAGHTEQDMNRLLEQYTKTVEPAVKDKVQALTQAGTVYDPDSNSAGFLGGTWALTKRNLLNNTRNIGIYWIRVGMYCMLALFLGTMYVRMGHTWKDSFMRAGCITWVFCFFCFMSIAVAPQAAEDMHLFVHERLNGYYTALQYVVANSLAAIPFIWAMGIAASLIVYWLADLNDEGDRFPHFFINLAFALYVAESVMMCLSAVVPHYLLAIAGGAAYFGTMMLINGFFFKVSLIPKAFWRYPMHYISFLAFTHGAAMQNEFRGTGPWGCACAELPGGCDPPCSYTGEDILEFWTSPGPNRLNKWGTIGILTANILVYRFFFWILLLVKEWMAT